MTENGTAPAPPDEDRTPTQSDEAPLIKPADQWVMPEPVFRRSSGFTPQVGTGDEVPTMTPDTISTLEIEPNVSTGNGADEASPPMIADQPDIVSEESAEPDNEGVVVVRKKGGFLRVLLIILGLVLVIGGIIVGAVLGFFWYFSRVSESQNLN
jgi:hypothetical protein